MAAAYAALVSLWHVIDQIEHHPRPPISLHKSQVQSLLHKITFLQEFLEGYDGSQEADHHHVLDLESRIADAAYAAENIIESRVVNQILARSKCRRVKISSIDLYQGLQIVIREMEMIKKKVMEIVPKKGSIQDDDHQFHLNSSISAHQIQEMDLIKTEIKEKTKVHRISTSLNSSTTEIKEKNTMVGLDDVKIDLMDKLTGQQSRRQIIPITGMGGIGKTTLARNIYESSLIVQHFHILAWTTISQQHNAKEILLQILLCLETSGSREMSEHELGEKLYQTLFGRRYLIVMDDMWSIEPWDNVRSFFPDNENGSRIMITTTLSNLACELTGSNGLEMGFLDEDKSWDLLCKNVDNSLEFVEIRRKIAKNCNGLPLSIVVIGGLLAKSKGTREYWQYIGENLNSIVKSEDIERCSKILQMSYDQLPIHLKPSFLYMGVYPEDTEIYVRKLMKLWVAEGFLKPISGKSLEEVAEQYLNELVDRNLVVVSERTYNGKVKRFKIHDLLMDLCVRESRKGKFLYLPKNDKLDIISRDMMSTQRRIAIHDGITPEIINALPCGSLVRSLTRRNKGSFPELFDYSLLRVWNGHGNGTELVTASAYSLLNCRYIASIRIGKTEPGFPSPFSLFWNLQTLIVVNYREEGVTVPSEFWKLSQLRHVMLNWRISLPDPLLSGDDEFVLTNLQTLQGEVRNFKLSEEVVKKIPNIKKLEMVYDGLEEWASSNFNNLVRLHKLESLSCSIGEIWNNNIVQSVGSEFVRSLTFPQLLKKLTLGGTELQWEDVTTKIGILPHLQVLKLHSDSVKGSEWETVEGQFCSLNYLQIVCCRNLENWTTESTHFPCLEHIFLYGLRNLKEIPLDIGEIPTLQSIELRYCSDSSFISAKEIVNQQEALGNEGLQVRVRFWDENEALESLASPNFLVNLQ